MEELKTDKRVVKTRALIRDAYFDSIRKIGFKKTTVKEICDRAYISRKTFYSHYETIDALFKEVMDECFVYQKCKASIRVHQLQVKYYYSDFNTYQQKVFELFVKQGNMIRETADVLRLFIESGEPEIEQYLRNRCINSELPYPEKGNHIQKMSWEIIGAEKYCFLKFIVLNPDIPIEDIAVFQVRTLDTYIHFAYTNSDTFLTKYDLLKYEQEHP